MENQQTPEQQYFEAMEALRKMLSEKVDALAKSVEEAQQELSNLKFALSHNCTHLCEKGKAHIL